MEGMIMVRGHGEEGMDDRSVIFADPFGSRGEGAAALPEEARLACAYEVFVQFEWFTEAAFLRRTETTDELWLGEGGVAEPGRSHAEASVVAALDRCRCALIVQRAGDERSACLGLLEMLIRARQGFCAPAEFTTPGIIDKAAYDGLVGRLKGEAEESKRVSRETETEIVVVAREAGLQPEPAGTGPGHWYATCPGKSHNLLIDAPSNTFGCGYCRRKGSPEDLRAFAAERRAAGRGGS